MRKIALLIFALSFVLSMPAFAQDKTPATTDTSAAKPLAPIPQTITPPKSWTDALGALTDLEQQRQELQSEVTALQNLESKKQQELVAQIPPGYSYDQTKQVFVKNPDPKPADKK